MLDPATTWFLLNVWICSDFQKIPASCGPLHGNYGPYREEDLCEEAMKKYIKIWEPLPKKAVYYYQCFPTRAGK